MTGLPIDYAYVVQVIAARNVAMARPVDFQYYLQLYSEAAREGLGDLHSWKNAQSDQGTPRFKLSAKYDVRSRRSRR